MSPSCPSLFLSRTVARCEKPRPCPREKQSFCRNSNRVFFSLSLSLSCYSIFSLSFPSSSCYSHNSYRPRFSQWILYSTLHPVNYLYILLLLLLFHWCVFSRTIIIANVMHPDSVCLFIPVISAHTHGFFPILFIRPPPLMYLSISIHGNCISLYVHSVVTYGIDQPDHSKLLFRPQSRSKQPIGLLFIFHSKIIPLRSNRRGAGYCYE